MQVLTTLFLRLDWRQFFSALLCSLSFHAWIMNEKALFVFFLLHFVDSSALYPSYPPYLADPLGVMYTSMSCLATRGCAIFWMRCVWWVFTTGFFSPKFGIHRVWCRLAHIRSIEYLKERLYLHSGGNTCIKRVG